MPCSCENHFCDEHCTCGETGSGFPPYWVQMEIVTCDGSGENVSDDTGLYIVPSGDNDPYSGIGGGTGGGGGPFNPTNTGGGDGMGTEFLIPREEWYEIKLMDLIDTFNLDLTVEELANIVPIACMGEGNPLAGVFEACAITALEDHIQSCLDPFYVLLPQLGITDIGSKLRLCNNKPVNAEEDPPGCEGCSVGEAQVVLSDHIQARGMLDCAIEKLANYDGTNPPDVKASLATNFGGEDDKQLGDLIGFLLKYVKFFSVGCEYTSQNVGDGFCGTNTDAWSYPATHLTNVRLCRPNYWNSLPLERRSTLIHEWIHLYLGNADWAYDWEGDYQNLNTLQQLLNADSFSEFVKQICL